jgi:hypothetical protein
MTARPDAARLPIPEVPVCAEDVTRASRARQDIFAPPPRWPSTLDGASWSKTPGRDQRRALGRRAGPCPHDHTRPRCRLRCGRRRSRPFPRAGPLHRRHDHHRDRLVARLIAPRGPRPAAPTAVAGVTAGCARQRRRCRTTVAATAGCRIRPPSRSPVARSSCRARLACWRDGA